MKKRIIGYRMKIDMLLAQPPKDADWKLVLQEHLTQVSFFQHERLIHLIVTVCNFDNDCIGDLLYCGVHTDFGINSVAFDTANSVYRALLHVGK